MNKEEVAIIGGCGHVGVRFGIVLANIGYDVKAIDLGLEKIEKVNRGEMPFIEVELFYVNNMLKDLLRLQMYKDKRFFNKAGLYNSGPVSK